MRLEDISNVLCLSCVLMFFYVSSQPSCPNGWFGPLCKYKCRCTSDSCNTDGSCTGSNRCQGGWFGPDCQYADLAYLTTTSPVLTDADDDTCNNASSGTTSQIMLNQSIVFCWLRIRIMNQGIDDFSQLSVSFSFNNSAVSCPALKKYDMDKTTQDIHCDLPANINEVTLTGQIVANICSVYVSGGRNVALKENAQQESDLLFNVSGVLMNFTADLAVDGNRSQDFYQLSCAHTRNTTTWNVRFPDHRSVNRYLLFNRLDTLSSRMRGFTMESFNALDFLVFNYTDQDTLARDNYTITHRPLPIQRVSVGFDESLTRFITLCEVEIYGDSICDPQHYGRDCEHSCNCSGYVACFVSTGGCPSGCPAGFYGIGCVTRCGVGRFGIYCNVTCSENCGSGLTSDCDSSGVCQTECRNGTTGPYCEDRCNVGTFGKNCSSSCSENCEPSAIPYFSSCDVRSGVCQSGCRIGFTGQSCQHECKLEYFGINCNASCSPNCVPPGQAGVSSCDNKTGACLKGCQSGFTGALCRDVIPAPATTSYEIEIIVGLCLILAAIFFLGYCFCMRRKPGPAPERTGASSKPAQVNAE